MVSLISLAVVLGQAQAQPKVITLFPNGAPGSESRMKEAETKPNPWSIGNIHNPTLTVFEPKKEDQNGTAVIICPGGGFRELVYGEEGVKPAEYLAKLGVTAFVLKYRLFREKDSGLTFETATRDDVFRAVRYVRANSAALGIKTNRIGMLGFSAGGEAVSMAAFGSAPPLTPTSDLIESTSPRLDFAAWIYPGPLGVPESIPQMAPPAFMLVANDDGASKVVMDLAKKYKEAGASAEVHILSGGGHGFNMGDRSNLAAVKSWPQRFADWLGDQGLLKKG